MLYKTEANPVQAEGFAETTHFDIPASGKAFKSLIDNIYSRKIEAPIRELSTNAFDAHIEAGLDEPFRMKLPTKFDLLFMVRDYGFGMSHDFIMGTGEHKGGGFKSLFQSTKDQDNTQVGMKGLGSKSPFAYTDSFILRIFNGKTVRTYSTYLGENGIPQLAYQGEAPSTERRGTAVQFPVQMKDIDAFYDSATRVLKGFPILPDGLPRTVLDRLTGSEATPLEQGKTWTAYHKDWLGEGAFVKQGCVIYPIDADKLDDAAWLKTLGMSLVLDVPIGSVQMVDSREFLSYDDETVANINAAVTGIHVEIDERIKTVMATAKTHWEIRALYRNDMFSNLGPLARSSTLYSRVSAINSFLKDGLPRNRNKRAQGEGVFYSAVCRYKTPSWKTASSQLFAVVYTRNDDAYNGELMDEPVFVYIGNDPKLRKGMNERANILLQENEQITSVVMIEKLPLKLHRKLGRAKIMRIADLPPLPPKPKVEREPVGWERFKEMTGVHGMREIDDDDPRDGEMTSVYLFVNKGSIFLPGVDRQFEKRTLYSEDRMLRVLSNTRIVYINVRLNEKMSRWPETEFPRYTEGLLDGVIPALPRAKIVPMINLINRARFEYSLYDRALDELGRDYVRREIAANRSNALYDLVRFDDRADRVHKVFKNLVDSFSEEMTEQVIERALSLGLEVLPEVCHKSHSEGPSPFPYPLISGKWERLAWFLAETRKETKRQNFINIIREG